MRRLARVPGRCRFQIVEPPQAVADDAENDEEIGDRVHVQAGESKTERQSASRDRHVPQQAETD